jgi:hypothetical protein
LTWWAGYYDLRKREIVVGNAQDYLTVLVHQINHFVLDSAFDEAPVWLREGLVVAEQPRHWRQLAEWLKETASRTCASSSPSTARCSGNTRSRAASAPAPSPGASWTS